MENRLELCSDLSTEFRVKDVNDGEGDEGIVHGYFATWDKVDSYNSTFKRGSFLKTLKEKGVDKIRMLWNHENGFNGKPLTIIGKPLEIREDDIGVYVSAKIFRDLPKGEMIWRLIKENVINTLSFGFTVLDSVYEKGVRVINEVNLYEFSPVAFEANPDARIKSIRHIQYENKESRATSFEESLTNIELSKRMDMLLFSLNNTLNDIWWEPNNDFDGIKALSDKAIDSFKDKYLSFIDKYALHFANNPDTRPSSSNLSSSLRKACKGFSMQEVAIQHPITISELTDLRNGKTISNPERLIPLSEELYQEHQKLVVSDESLLYGIRQLNNKLQGDYK